MKNILLSGFLILLITNCQTTSSPPEEGFGPCVHTYEDPILAIESVSDRSSGEQVSKIVISDIIIDSVKKDPSSLTDQPSQNVSIQDSTLVCTIPCGFGTKEGTYQFSAHASGYQDTTLTFEEVNYEIFDGGCPSSNSGSTEISFEMKRQ